MCVHERIKFCVRTSDGEIDKITGKNMRERISTRMERCQIVMQSIKSRKHIFGDGIYQSVSNCFELFTNKRVHIMIRKIAM